MTTINEDELTLRLLAITENVPYTVSNLANASALVWEAFDRINWAGFYVMQNGRLILGPFQGKVACIEIDLSRGVCGKCASTDRTVIVPDVHLFPGHIACDSASRSEIVIPIHKDGKVWGVLDIDSPFPDRFSASDAAVLESFVAALETRL